MFRRRRDAPVSTKLYDMHNVEKSWSSRFDDDISTYVKLAETNGFAERVTAGVVEDALSGSTTDKAFNEKFERVVEKASIQMRTTGIGIAVKRVPNETVDDWDTPWTPGKTGFEALCFETEKWMPVLPGEFFTNLHEVSEFWQLQPYGVKVHHSRLVFFQVKGKDFDWRGLSELKACKAALEGLWKLTNGLEKRVETYNLGNVIGMRVPEGTVDNSAAAVREALGLTSVLKISGSDDIIQLANSQGHGTELQTLLLNEVCAATKLPRLLILGESHGAVAGSKSDLSLAGQWCQQFRKRIQPFVTEVYEKEVEWNEGLIESIGLAETDGEPEPVVG